MSSVLWSTKLKFFLPVVLAGFQLKGNISLSPLSCRYFTDVSHLPAVSAAIQQMNQSTGRIAAAVTKALEGWRVHSHVWKANKDALIAKLQVGLPTIFIGTAINSGIQSYSHEYATADLSIYGTCPLSTAGSVLIWQSVLRTAAGDTHRIVRI